MSDFAQVISTVREFFIKHRQLLAFLVLALASAYSIYSVQQHSIEIDRSSREDRAAIIDGGERSVRFGCEQDEKTISQIRKIVLRARPTYEKLYEEGTINRIQYDRFNKEIDRTLKIIPLPNCENDVRVFLKAVEGVERP